MSKAIAMSGWYRGVAAAATLVAALITFSQCTAVAQQLVAVVNGEPITAIDIAQRSKLIQLSTHKTPTHQEVLDELIDEKLKLQVGKYYKLEVTDSEIDQAFAGIARRVRATPEQFAQLLTKAGINVPAFKIRLKADMVWSQIIRGKFQGNFQFRERDILDALRSRRPGEESQVGYEYTLRPILLIVPRGSLDAVFAARKREADALRTRFENCDAGIAFARNLKDVAIREQIIRTSADFPAKLREILDGTAVGRLTPPETTQQGIEMFAVCAKKQSSGDMPGKREVRDEMMQTQFVAQGKRYLQELRRKAMIEYK